MKIGQNSPSHPGATACAGQTKGYGLVVGDLQEPTSLQARASSPTHVAAELAHKLGNPRHDESWYQGHHTENKLTPLLNQIYLE